MNTLPSAPYCAVSDSDKDRDIARILASCPRLAVIQRAWTHGLLRGLAEHWPRSEQTPPGLPMKLAAQHWTHDGQFVLQTLVQGGPDAAQKWKATCDIAEKVYSAGFGAGLLAKGLV